MTRPILIANPHALVWLPRLRNGQTAAALVEKVQAGRWRLPRLVRALFIVPRRLKLSARAQGRLVIIRPDKPLRPRRPSAALTPEQRIVLQALARGLTTDQIALALGRQRRYACYQIAEVRRKLGVTSRAEAVKARKRLPGQP